MAFSDALYQSIEIAVKTTGQQAVADLDAQLARAKQSLDLWKQALAAGIVPASQFAEETEKINQDITHFTEVVAAANRVMQGLPANLNAGSQAMNRLGYAMLNVSYAAQDLQYGFGAVVNNISLVTTSIAQASPAFARMTAAVGGPMGLGAIMMGLGVGIQVVHDNWDKITGAFEDFIGNTGPKAIQTVEELKDELKQLEAKPHRTIIDTADIDIAREKLHRLTAEEAAYERLKTGKTEEQQKRSKLVSEAITEGGGATDLKSGVDNVIGAVQEALPVQDSPETTQLKADIEEHQKWLKNPNISAFARNGLIAEIKDAQQKILRNKSQEILNSWTRARSIVTGAAQGREADLATLSGAFGANEGAFTRRGVDPLRFGAGLENASGDNLFADERQKEADRIAKQDQDRKDAEQDLIYEESSASGKRAADYLKGVRLAEKKEKGVYDKRVNEDVTRLFPGFDDPLVQSLYNAIGGGTDPRAAMRKERAPLIPKLRGRGVTEDIVSDVAQKILEKAADKAQNLINEGGKPKLTKESETAQQKTERANNREQSAIRREGVQLGAGYVPQVQGMMAKAAMAGADQGDMNQLYGQMQAYIRNVLKSQGVVGSEQMAYAIVQKGVEEFNRENQKNLAITGNMLQALAATLADAMNDQRALGMQLQQTFTKLNQGAANQARGQVRGGTGQITFPY